MDLAKAITRALAKEIAEAARTTSKQLHSEARRLSDGPKRAPGYYARSSGATSGVPTVARRSGNFYLAWKGSSRGKFPGSVEVIESNADRKADWLNRGTRKMVERPIESHLERYGEQLFIQLLEKNLS